MTAKVPMHSRYQVHQRAVRAAASAGWPAGMVRGLGQTDTSGCDPADPLCGFYGGDVAPTPTGSGAGVTTCQAASPLNCPAGTTWVYSPPVFPSSIPSTSTATGTSPAAAPGGATFGSVNWGSVINNAVASLSRIGQIAVLPGGSTISPAGGVSIANPAVTQLTSQIGSYLPLILLGGGAILLVSMLGKK